MVHGVENVTGGTAVLNNDTQGLELKPKVLDADWPSEAG